MLMTHPVLQRATKRGAPPPSETWASTAVHASTNPNTVKLFALPLLRSGAREICRHAHCVLIFAHERQR